MRLILVPGARISSKRNVLQRRIPPPARADADGVRHWADEDLAVADRARAGRLDDDVDGALRVRVLDDKLDLALGQHVHPVLLTTSPRVDDALLDAAAGDVDDVEADEARGVQKLFHHFQPLRPDDRFDFVHRFALLVSLLALRLRGGR